MVVCSRPISGSDYSWGISTPTTHLVLILLSQNIIDLQKRQSTSHYHLCTFLGKEEHVTLLFVYICREGRTRHIIFCTSLGKEEHVTLSCVYICREGRTLFSCLPTSTHLFLHSPPHAVLTSTPFSCSSSSSSFPSSFLCQEEGVASR